MELPFRALNSLHTLMKGNAGEGIDQHHFRCMKCFAGGSTSLSPAHYAFLPASQARLPVVLLYFVGFYAVHSSLSFQVWLLIGIIVSQESNISPHSQLHGTGLPDFMTHISSRKNLLIRTFWTMCSWIMKVLLTCF